MEFFDIDDSESPEYQLPTTSNIKKVTMKGTSPNKVTKKTPISSPSRALKNSPVPKTKAEIQPYDQLVLDLRARNPPTPWKEIETLYRDAGGITTGHLNLKVRIGLLEALEEEMTETEIQDLIAAKQAVEEEFQKQVWGLVAEKLKVEKGREWNAKFLKNTCDGLKKGTL
ncbi:hypothetical protein GLAREA_09351 [Glarea lozoyensis ATCC 20868]|uniref:Uncharacterized protein n=1 Tax=Glarea lozoyensis (strain ATCC 20868 / MF5171) TaxID=1116229 RepID=S3D8A3_GLAL2|nr:uncharacterized protein GLAREA_09351 [Glarea lozoyensis ATCC 20868]EPE28231.1 hypothetical protein GLAREA_09351 [Glarea lozoyensis ATCC 20868]